VFESEAWVIRRLQFGTCRLRYTITQLPAASDESRKKSLADFSGCTERANVDKFRVEVLQHLQSSSMNDLILPTAWLRSRFTNGMSSRALDALIQRGPVGRRGAPHRAMGRGGPNFTF